MSGPIAALERRIADLEARLNSTVRVGRISATDPDTGRARVIFDAPGGEVTTAPLPILYPRALTERDQWTHRPGEHVVCIMLPTGREDGFIIGAYYAGTATPGGAGDRIVHGDTVDVRGDTAALITSDDVRLGGAAASEAVLLGDTWSTWVTSILQTHTHPTGVGPSGPSSELSAAPPTGHLSGTVRTR